MRLIMEQVLFKIAQVFAQENIQWGIGGSLLLKHYDLVKQARDIDIIIDKKDIDKALNLLDMMAERQAIPEKKEYLTEHFYVYAMENISIDIMVNFRIRHHKGNYDFIFDKHSIVKSQEEGQPMLAYTRLEDWLVAYALMEGRQAKVEMIRSYFERQGGANKLLLNRALEQELPEGIQSIIKQVLAYS